MHRLVIQLMLPHLLRWNLPVTLLDPRPSQHGLVHRTYVSLGPTDVILGTESA